MIIDPTKRFSSRVENYIKYRPGYPAAILDLLKEQCGLTRASVIADVGSGTGILTELLLKNCSPVFGVEPNRDMREAAERLLGKHSNFTSISGTAECTTLKDQSVDVITAGQAFHWFDREKTRHEFLRILKPGGWVVLIWNDRNTTARPFFKAYEELLMTYATDYAAVNHKQIDPEMISAFFGAAKFKPNSEVKHCVNEIGQARCTVPARAKRAGRTVQSVTPDNVPSAPGTARGQRSAPSLPASDFGFKHAIFPNEQVFDFEGLRGRLLSSSYSPEAGHPKHTPMLNALRAVFDNHQTTGKVTFEYDTSVFYGQPSA
jgi:ubiquinone/menaquinone biosynthesis C-methylase UbiE